LLGWEFSRKLFCVSLSLFHSTTTQHHPVFGGQAASHRCVLVVWGVFGSIGAFSRLIKAFSGQLGVFQRSIKVFSRSFTAFHIGLFKALSWLFGVFQGHWGGFWSLKYVSGFFDPNGKSGFLFFVSNGYWGDFMVDQYGLHRFFFKKHGKEVQDCSMVGAAFSFDGANIGSPRNAQKRNGANG
jgi:hypothetical protein